MEQINNEFYNMIDEIQLKYIDISDKLDKYIDKMVEKYLGKIYCKYHFQKKESYRYDDIVKTIYNHSMLMTEFKKYYCKNNEENLPSIRIRYSNNNWNLV